MCFSSEGSPTRVLSAIFKTSYHFVLPQGLHQGFADGTEVNRVRII